MPWTSKDLPATTKQPNSIELLYKAMKNFSLSLYRVSFPALNPAYTEAETKSKKLIIVDKSIEKMFIYDLETRKKEKEYAIGIGKGGLTPRRYVGDHSTPTGTYSVVGKRDDAWWKENKGVNFPDVYGGKDGGMLVLAGQWHPEIAVHGSDQATSGQVSNGCVRVENKDIKTLMKVVPVGSMIIITN
jgi:lipoprotein-anchoring transpeptidase ErfK/SrfK